MAPQNTTIPRGVSTERDVSVRVLTGSALVDRLPELSAFVAAPGRVCLSRHPRWLTVLEESLGHRPYAIEARRGNEVTGYLGLAYVRSLLFGRFLVSLPYLNYGGVMTSDPTIARTMIDSAAKLARELGVRYLELRHEWAIEHADLTHRRSDKVHMRLDLPAGSAALWEQLSPKVRNQVRKAMKGGFAVRFGGPELAGEFYDVFSRNMRDLGTPVFGRRLFDAILRQFPDQSEICVVRDGSRPVAAALLLHGSGISEVPSASSLREYNPACVNMLMYWHLLERATQRGQDVFDFGRSSEGSSTYRFKKQWGAMPSPAEWQYCLLRGAIGDMRPDHPKYGRMIALWKRLPLWLTRVAGPRIVRGIP
jgi:FemAB-related protein (PEP-CTERM system-associated)